MRAHVASVSAAVRRTRAALIILLAALALGAYTVSVLGLKACSTRASGGNPSGCGSRSP